MDRNTPAFEGILLVDKPTECTSHDVVARLRQKLNIRRIGHAGTLDPMATGLLILLVGKATKVSHFLTHLDKTYVGTILLGKSTNTHDADGDILQEASVPSLSAEQIQTHFNHLTGDQYQLPPMFSAKKIKGVPLYKLARKGKVMERKPRLIHVFSYEVLEVSLPKIEFQITCSKGTYVRTLAHDLGQEIGCGAHLSALRRTAIGHFSIKKASSLPALESASLEHIRSLLMPVYQAVPSHVL